MSCGGDLEVCRRPEYAGSAATAEPGGGAVHVMTRAARMFGPVEGRFALPGLRRIAALVAAGGMVAVASGRLAAQPDACTADDLQLVRRAAEQGMVDAQTWLASQYSVGGRCGVQQDFAEAFRWWRLAAEQGDASAQHFLGLMYEGGRGVPQNEAEAVRWYRLAAEKGDAYAQDALRRIAEQGNVDAQNALGVMYTAGQGVQQDEAEAVRWWRLAARGGSLHAQA